MKMGRDCNCDSSRSTPSTTPNFWGSIRVPPIRTSGKLHQLTILAFCSLGRSLASNFDTHAHLSATEIPSRFFNSCCRLGTKSRRCAVRLWTQLRPKLCIALHSLAAKDNGDNESTLQISVVGWRGSCTSAYRASTNRSSCRGSRCETGSNGANQDSRHGARRQLSRGRDRSGSVCSFCLPAMRKRSLGGI